MILVEEDKNKKIRKEKKTDIESISVTDNIEEDQDRRENKKLKIKK